jgi:hypothetical protein
LIVIGIGSEIEIRFATEFEFPFPFPFAFIFAKEVVFSLASVTSHNLDLLCVGTYV